MVRWRRRAAAVSLVVPARRGFYLDDVFRVAEPLMTDADDLVRKGVGWLLKEASRQHPGEVVEFLLRWRDRTSRVVLRYACELMPPATRDRVLKGG
jgi:3-methyladenine DNA glycosylase AlkD